MKKTLRIGLLVCAAAAVAAVALWAQNGESIDAAAWAKIKAEGLDHSQTAETLFWISDAGGPRLTGTPAYEATGDWVVKQLQQWGIADAHKERWNFDYAPKGWTLTAFSAMMTAPQPMPIIGTPEAWSQGTNGPLSAPVVRADIATTDDLVKYKGKLRGAIVLTQPARAVRMLDQPDAPLVLIMTPKDIAEAMTEPAPGAGRGAGRGARGGAAATPGAAPRVTPAQLSQFYKDEGVVALFNRGGNSDTASGGSNLSWRQQVTDGGTVFVQGVSPRDGSVLPTITLAVEHYNRMARLVDHNVPVRVDLNVGVKWTDPPAGGGAFNIVGDIPGSDPALKNQIVMVGAHFDSWQGADGATDNGTGDTAMMEVMRILQATGLHPRRTVRIGLWGGEEEGELGSKAYVAAHLGTRANPKPEAADMDVYYNLDNGTGRIRGVWMQGNAQITPIFQQWIAPLKDLNVDLLSPRSVQQTDHQSFDAVGIPAFQFVQERLEYNSRTHHSNMDYYDHVQFDDLKEQATIAAYFVWQAANRDQPLPRKPTPQAAAGQK